MSDEVWRLAAPARPRPVHREMRTGSPHQDSAPSAPSSATLDTSRAVLIIDGGSRADLGLARSLGFAGIPVHLLTSGRDSVTARSRYVTQTHAFPHWTASDDERVARIRAVAKSLRSRPMVLPSGDQALSFLSRRRADFADVIDHDLPDAHVVSNCLDKVRFARIAERLSPAGPARWSPRDPGYKAGPDGEVALVHVYVEPSGRTLGSFTGIAASARPPEAGVGIAITSRRNERLAALAVDIVARLHHSGFAILHFRRDPGSDAFRLIEINCRYGEWTELPSRSGCNFPVAAYATITGQAAPVLAQREGVRCWAFFALDDPAPFIWQLLTRKAR